MIDSSDNLDALIEEAARKQGIDPELFRRLIMQESGGNPGAISPKGASGLGQLMPGTAQEMGVTDPTDPRQNLFGSAKYFKIQQDKFKDPKLAAAAYNAGPGNVQKYGGVPPFKETQDYVSRLFPSYTGNSSGVGNAFTSGIDDPTHPDLAGLFENPLGPGTSSGGFNPPPATPDPRVPQPQPSDPVDDLITEIRKNGLLDGLNSPNLYEEAGKQPSAFATANADLDSLKQAIASRPQQKDYERGTGGKILDSVLAAGTGYLRGPKAGMDFGTELLDEPYNKAMAEYKGRTSGLENIAELSGKQANMEAQSQDRRLRVLGLLEAAKARKGGASRPIKITTTKNGVTTEEYVTPEEAVSRGAYNKAATTSEQNRLDQAGKIELQAPHVKQLVDIAASKASPSLVGKIGQFFGINSQVGPAGGRIAELDKMLGSESEDVRKLFYAMQSLDALMPVLHGYRGGAQTHKVFTEALGSLHTNPQALKGAIDEALALARNIKNGTAQTLDESEQAKEEAAAGFGGSSSVSSPAGQPTGKQRKLKDGTVIYEEQ